MEKILQIIAEETHGKSYRTSRIELDAENFSAEIVLAVPDKTNPRGFDGGFFLRSPAELMPAQKSKSQKFSLTTRAITLPKNLRNAPSLKLWSMSPTFWARPLPNTQIFRVGILITTTRAKLA